MDTGPNIITLARHVQAAIAATGGDDHRLGAIFAAIAGVNTVVIVMAVDVDDILRLQNLHPKARGLLTQAIGKFNAGNALGKAGQIIELFGRCGLTTDGGPLNH